MLTQDFHHLAYHLVCPITGGELVYDADKNIFISRLANVYYPIESNIPILIPSEAIALTQVDTNPVKR